MALLPNSVRLVFPSEHTVHQKIHGQLSCSNYFYFLFQRATGCSFTEVDQCQSQCFVLTVLISYENTFTMPVLTCLKIWQPPSCWTRWLGWAGEVSPLVHYRIRSSSFWLDRPPCCWQVSNFSFSKTIGKSFSWLPIYVWATFWWSSGGEVPQVLSWWRGGGGGYS